LKQEKLNYVEQCGFDQNIDPLSSQDVDTLKIKQSYENPNVTFEDFKGIVDNFLKNKKQKYYNNRYQPSIFETNESGHLVSFMNEDMEPFIDGSNIAYNKFKNIADNYLDKYKNYAQSLNIQTWYSVDQTSDIMSALRDSKLPFKTFNNKLRTYENANIESKQDFYSAFSKNNNCRFTKEQENEITNQIINRSVGVPDFETHIKEIYDLNLAKQKKKEDCFNRKKVQCQFDSEQEKDIKDKILDNEMEPHAFEEYINAIVDQKLKEIGKQCDSKWEEIVKILNEITRYDPKSGSTFKNSVENIYKNIVSTDSLDENSFNDAVDKLIIEKIN